MPADGFRILQSGISERQQELHRLAEILAKEAKKKGRAAVMSKVTTISLGAFTATQAVAAKLTSEGNAVVIALYAFAGLVIAAVGSIDAAFKLDGRASELKLLAAQCQSTIWQIDADWSKYVGTSTGEEQIAAARALLDRQDTALADIQSRAAQAGVNITMEVRELYGTDVPALA